MFKENFSIFPNMQKNFGILHRIQHQLALDKMQSQWASNGSAITGFKTMKIVCIKCLFWSWAFQTTNR